MKYKCGLCNYETDIHSSFKRHKMSKSHRRNEGEEDPSYFGPNQEEYHKTPSSDLDECHVEIMEMRKQIREMELTINKLSLSESHLKEMVDMFKLENEYHKEQLMKANISLRDAMDAISHMSQNRYRPQPSPQYNYPSNNFIENFSDSDSECDTEDEENRKRKEEEADKSVAGLFEELKMKREAAKNNQYRG